MGGKVRVVFKQYPLSNQCNPALNRDMHPAACPGAIWSMAANDQGKFWEYADKVFENMANLMPKEGDEAAKKAGLDANLERFAKEAGVDIAKARAYMDSKKWEPRLKKDLEEAGKAKVGGTPSIFINGRQYNDNPTPDAIKKAIEGLLSKK